MANSDIGLVRFVPFVFLMFLIVAIPFLARVEEEMFRGGNVDWTDIIKQSVKFGLIHCLFGVPPAFGIALIGSGFFYACKYRKEYLRHIEINEDWVWAEEEAILMSTTYHTLYNSIVIISSAILLAVI